MGNFQLKKFDIFLIFAQNIDCGYTLEPPRRGGSNEYPHRRGSRNFHERGSNENGNFLSQTRGGPTPQKSRKYLFLGKIFKFQGGSGPPVPPSGSAHATIYVLVQK